MLFTVDFSLDFCWAITFVWRFNQFYSEFCFLFGLKFNRIVDLTEMRKIYLRAWVIFFLFTDQAKLFELILLALFRRWYLLLLHILLIVGLLLEVFNSLYSILKDVLRSKTANFSVFGGRWWTLVYLFGKSTCFNAFTKRNQSSTLFNCKLLKSFCLCKLKLWHSIIDGIKTIC